MSGRRLLRRRRYERALGVNYRGLYGYTARHVRCDSCQRDYMPQHVRRVGWRWECGNCSRRVPATPRPVLRFRYADDPRMLAALGLA